MRDADGLFMVRIRRFPPPLRVTRPPPSRTVFAFTFAVSVRVTVTGFGPHEKVITPPAVTAVSTACDVQLVGVPSPTTWVGFDVSSARASGGTAAFPAGLPAGWIGGGGGALGGAEADTDVEDDEVVTAADDGGVVSTETETEVAGAGTTTPAVVVAQPATMARRAAAGSRRMPET
ncbi:hypothetical protein [Actinocrispum wychmicini]|uniref:hypothetical protein n=1 Tax=Actinocrispum wychmicini TaxID=1213861 RepID=UPI001053E6E5|nr:hypothetical protein [Actinocrispum wychmicini]